MQGSLKLTATYSLIYSLTTLNYYNRHIIKRIVDILLIKISNKDKYRKSFQESLNIGKDQLNEKLKYNEIPE